MSQTTATAMESVRRDFAQLLLTSYGSGIHDPPDVVNMDDTATYMDCSPNRTIHKTGEGTVSIMIGVPPYDRFTSALSVAMDGTKRPLFVILKG